ncbi:MAG: hypothetical protein F6K31_41505, partial [Symploca sp. SIO2G7]|nr:hypothetical protein [Symploca sp. SIO2G7]
MKHQRFWHTKRRCHLYLPVADFPGMFIFMGKPWTPDALKALGFVQEPNEQKVEQQSQLVFGDPSRFQGSFCKTQGKGSAPSWG